MNADFDWKGRPSPQAMENLIERIAKANLDEEFIILAQQQMYYSMKMIAFLVENGKRDETVDLLIAGAKAIVALGSEISDAIERYSDCPEQITSVVLSSLTRHADQNLEQMLAVSKELSIA